MNAFVDGIALPLAMVGMRISPRRARRPATRLVVWGMRRFARPPYGAVLKVDATGERDGKTTSRSVTVSHPNEYQATGQVVAAYMSQWIDGSARKPGIHAMGTLVEPERFLRYISSRSAFTSRTEGDPSQVHAMRNVPMPGLTNVKPDWIATRGGRSVDISARMSMSLDGFIAGRTTNRVTPGATASFGCTTGSASSDEPGPNVQSDTWGPRGTISGRSHSDRRRRRRPADRGAGRSLGRWSSRVPIFVPSHRPPGPSVANYPQVTYVTDGIVSAMAQAKAAAGDRNVLVHGAARHNGRSKPAC